MAKNYNGTVRLLQHNFDLISYNKKIDMCNITLSLLIESKYVINSFSFLSIIKGLNEEDKFKICF